MSQVARSLLIKLLAQVDRGGRETLPINDRSAKDYFGITDLNGRDRIHAYLENAEKGGGIWLEWGVGAESQDLERLRIRDADKLADWLEIPRAKTHAERIEKELIPLIQKSPEWLQNAFEKAMSLWSLGKKAFGISVEDAASAINLFKVAMSISAGEHNDLDLRRYSVRLLNNSKTIEGMLNKLAPLLRYNPEWEQYEDNNDLFRLLGLEKFPPPIYIKGPLNFKYSRVQLDISQLRPFIGLSPDQVEDIALSQQTPYVLTIENLASFQRHVREINDEGIVIYSAGFPSPALRQILQWIDMCVPNACPFFHWGDRDIGGIRIFAHIDSVLSRHNLCPHLMLSVLENKNKFNKDEYKQIKKYQNIKGPVGNMAKFWLDNELGAIEQEVQDPVSPVLI